MGIFGRLFGKTLPNDLQGTRGWETLIKYSCGDTWEDADEVFGKASAALCEKAYANHALIAACAKLRANVAAQPRLEIGMESADSEAWEPVKSHPLLDLINSPMREISRSKLIKSAVIAHGLTGLGYIWKIRNKSRSQVVALFPLPTSWVTPVRAKDSERYFKAYRVQNQKESVDVNDMATLRDPDPRNPSRGIGFVEQAWRAHVLDMERESYQGEVTKNLKHPGTVISTEKPVPEDQREKARTEFRDRFGRGKRGEIAFLGGNAKIEIMNPLKDMDWPGLTGLSETRICAAAGVPPILIGARAGLDRSTYSNYEQAKKAFYLSTMAPLWEDIADDLTLSFQDELGSALRFRFRYDALPEFQGDENQKATRVIQLFSAGLMPWPVAVKELGYDPGEMAAITRGHDESVLENVSAENTVTQGNPVIAEDDVQKTALNGAQVTALQEVVRNVATGQISQEAAVLLIQMSFPRFTLDEIQRMIAAVEVNPQQIQEHVA